MTIVGELINTSRKEVKEAVANKDEALIRRLAREQADAGATYIDVNCGNLIGHEVEVMEWLVRLVQDEVDTPLCIDSPSAEALEAGLALCENGCPMINSISDEEERYDSVLPLIKKYNTKIVVLCMDSTGMPVTAEDRMKVVKKLHAKLAAEGIADEDMFFDPLVKPISSVTSAGIEVLDTIRAIKRDYPDVHFMCGLSNISYGLPNRSILNRLFVVQTMTLGMDGYVLNPTNRRMMADIVTATALLGQDNYCGKYIKAHRKGLFDE
ncbi:MAG: methyltetrahydrofolate cobalamin methyltransferase [Eubacterium aggregans]|uniref:methyltetrahydrofolate cobalamin methyltransferase n=1 Tax=Eubacterium aggregans TaxID=81409 RepID=UPI001FA79DCC|nr:methyltetrahydrofolate cobalamin methyltransferase [Eubacterium aggregans]MDD4691648.1 methyltetrahydrofolate cobalamin methyltransferase [Eubacterium aggregans]MEA5074266.1 methyltetrahydrofolate cobalamin methyltransferase [Eubacterium aggregans]